MAIHRPYKAHKYTPELIEQMRKLRIEKKLTYKKIGEKMKIPTKMVYKLLIERGFKDENYLIGNERRLRAIPKFEPTWDFSDQNIEVRA